MNPSSLSFLSSICNPPTQKRLKQKTKTRFNLHYWTWCLHEHRIFEKELVLQPEEWLVGTMGCFSCFCSLCNAWEGNEKTVVLRVTESYTDPFYEGNMYKIIGYFQQDAHVRTDFYCLMSVKFMRVRFGYSNDWNDSLLTMLMINGVDRFSFSLWFQVDKLFYSIHIMKFDHVWAWPFYSQNDKKFNMFLFSHFLSF